MKIAMLIPDNRDESGRYGDPAPYFGTAPTALLEGLAEIRDCEIHIVSCVHRRMTAPEKIAGHIFYHAVKVGRWGWSRGGYAGCVLALRKKLREIQPDLVHGQGTERYCALAAVLSGLPNVITIHGNMRQIALHKHARPVSFHWVAARLEKFVLPRTNGVICITAYTQRAVAGLARRTWICPNAVDASFFDVNASPDLTAPPIGLCVGTICGYKNQNDFIRALDPLANQKKFKLVFLGQPEAGDYGREFLRLVGERAWCEHAGFVNREQLKARLKTASFLVLPTREDNCPMVVLEAMAAGVPVLASQIGGVPDLFEDGKTGLFCDPDRPESFRAGVDRLLNDRLLATRLTAAAKRHALEKFHPLTVAQGHVQIYHEVLKTRS